MKKGTTNLEHTVLINTQANQKDHSLLNSGYIITLLPSNDYSAVRNY